MMIQNFSEIESLIPDDVPANDFVQFWRLNPDDGGRI